MISLTATAVTPDCPLGGGVTLSERYFDLKVPLKDGTVLTLLMGEASFMTLVKTVHKIERELEENKMKEKYGKEQDNGNPGSGLIQ